MASYSLLSVLFILVVLMAVNAGIIEDTCKDVSSIEDGVNYDFCVNSLQAAPGAGSADKAGLAKIVTELAISNATSTKGKIDSMAKAGGTDPDIKPALDACSIFYATDIRVMTEAMAAIKAGHFAEAVPQINSTRNDPLACDLNFFTTGKSNPFKDECDDLMALMTISLRILVTLG